MLAWTCDGVRVDIELSVALEVAALGLDKAEDAQSRAAALDYNRSVWELIAALAPHAAQPSDRVELAAHAERVLAGLEDDVSALNSRCARSLAGRAATKGALRLMLSDWRNHVRVYRGAEFGAWLVARLGGLYTRASRSAA